MYSAAQVLGVVSVNKRASRVADRRRVNQSANTGDHPNKPSKSARQRWCVVLYWHPLKEQVSKKCSMLCSNMLASCKHSTCKLHVELCACVCAALQQPGLGLPILCAPAVRVPALLPPLPAHPFSIAVLTC